MRGRGTCASGSEAASASIVGRVAFVAVLSGCGGWQGPPPGSAGAQASNRVKDQPDDRDLPALIPVGVQTVIDVDMAALRRSAWTSPIMEGRDPKTRATKAEALGYDDVEDVDRIIYAVTTVGVAAPTLVVAQGRFQSSRVEDAFRARWPAAVVDRWRGILVLSSGENAIAFLTARTFTSGAPTAVRAVVDRAHGVGADIEADPALGTMRRALCPEGPDARPVILATIAVDDRLRARVGDAVLMPRELRQVGLRVDAGQSLDVNALGILDDRKSASALGRRLGMLLSDPMTRLGLSAIGLGMLLPQTRVTIDGARVRVRTSIDGEARAQVTASLRVLVDSVRGGDGTGVGSGLGAGSPGSW